MKSTGVTRNIDRLGRIVIPKELRWTLGIIEKDPVEIFVEGDKIILQKYRPYEGCIITGGIPSKSLSLANGKMLLSSEGVEILIKELQQYLVE
ncbi:AbrB/MazE/SpoVT family DNA-binding domain-containing protein [Bacillus mycoides]|uniref:AbrB/MazE/SpoVT family DNA-binding domain-containing protein n=1 Tax=Bacillus mycoides TaxID=1405 RepID=UPI0011A84A96|nr:AbrB/MazE/SpoVT family DNA-binding domain-containing protein [Bacillus mycoides]